MSVLPIFAYGDPVLKIRAKPIDKDYPDLQRVIEDMWETMYNAVGLGIAAPQVGKSIRIFIIDTTPFADEESGFEGFKRVFINAEILEETGKPWLYNEGCLSFPELGEDIKRLSNICIRYQDENFNTYEENFSGLIARIIQHEYDHIEGKLMTDHFSPLKRTLLKKKLSNISKGSVSVKYPMNFPLEKYDTKRAKTNAFIEL